MYPVQIPPVYAEPDKRSSLFDPELTCMAQHPPALCSCVWKADEEKACIYGVVKDELKRVIKKVLQRLI